MTLKTFLWKNGFKISGRHRDKIARRFYRTGVFPKVKEGLGFVNDYPEEYLMSQKIIKTITDYLIEYSNSKIEANEQL